MVGDIAMRSPLATLDYTLHLLGSAAFWPHLSETARAFAAALAIAIALGLAIGFWLGFHRLSGEVMEPMLVALYSIPKITLYPLVLLAFPAIHFVDRIGSHPRMMAKGLVADDRAEPLLAAGSVAQGGTTAPGPEQRILGDVLRLVGITRVVVGHAQAETVRLIPLPTVSLIRILNDRNVD